jgi:hypothetical protein
MRAPLLALCALCACSTDGKTELQDTATVDGPGTSTGPGAHETGAPPIADAGDDQVVVIPITVHLSGAGSFDPDGDPMAYAWSFVSAPAGTDAWIDLPTHVEAAFDADRPGTYELRLTVDDGGAVDDDLVTIIAELPNGGPVADAGPDQDVRVGDTVVLDGSGSFDPEDDALAFSWALDEVPAGSAATLSAPSAESPTFLADVEGTYRATLSVWDGEVDSATDEISVTALPAGGGDDGGCLNCAAAERDLLQRIRSGDVAGGLLGLLPLFVVLRRRRSRAASSSSDTDAT